MKAGLDGMSLALGVNDRCFKKITVERADETGGTVKIVLG
jgi:hypothetical protein